MSGLSIAKSLELMMVRPTVSHDDVRNGCELARQQHLAAVCVFPVHVALAGSVLQGSDTKVCAAIGFPFGQETIPAKLVAIEQAQSDGASEMVVALDHSTLASGDVAGACRELERLCSSTYWGSLVSTRGRSMLTVVVETPQLDIDMLGPLWQMLRETPVGFVQTSSGHTPRAVTEDHVQHLRRLLPEDVAIKAVGGVHGLDEARALLSSGAVRVGTGSAVAIVQEEQRERKVNSVP